MNMLDHIFSLFCSQIPDRSFMIVGHFLPCCQRCTGVYLGMGISALYLLVSRLCGKPMPSRRIIHMNVLGIALMPIFGLHLLDPGPAWRLWSGLLFGNGLIFLMLPATEILVRGYRSEYIRHRSGWLGFVFLFLFINSIPFWFPLQSVVFYYAIILVAVSGLICIVCCPLAVVFAQFRKYLGNIHSKGLKDDPLSVT
jgi:uncharacterized membrane protein